jgi:hypothetical protein
MAGEVLGGKVGKLYESLIEARGHMIPDKKVRKIPT